MSVLPLPIGWDLHLPRPPVRPAPMTDANKLLAELRLLDIDQDAERMRRGLPPLPRELVVKVELDGGVA